jgi:hypothetical protein
MPPSEAHAHLQIVNLGFERVAIAHFTRALLICLNVHGIFRHEAPDMHSLGLAVTPDTTDCLSLGRSIDILSLGQKGRQENCVIGIGKVTANIVSISKARRSVKLTLQKNFRQ